MLAAATPRTYRSSQREERSRLTRGRMIEAATSLFVDRGYAGTTMTGVATAAGVAVPTLELAFRTKAGLLKAAIDVAIAGDDQPLPVLQREWVRRARSSTSAGELLDIVTAVLGPAQQRSAGLLLALFEGARTDPALGGLAEQMMQQRAGTATALLDLVAAVAPVRADLSRDDAVDTLWTLMDPALFDRLVRQRGWPVERYQAWLAASLRRLLVPDHPQHDPPSEEER